jgi:plasmid stabilization system protein ParE
MTEASIELVETVAFYDKRQTGLGVAFIAEFEKCMRLIQQYPDSGRHSGTHFRRVLTNRFPYAVIYVEREEEFLVVAIAHTSRRPGYWKDRGTGS